jgi:hypothetical protein
MTSFSRVLAALLCAAILAAEGVATAAAVPAATAATAPPLAVLGVVGKAVDDVACIDHLGRLQRLSEQTDATLVVVVAYTVGCPILRQAAADLSALAAAYQPKGVRLWYLDANAQDSRAEIAADAARLAIAQPVLHDPAQVAGEALGLTRAAEALVIRSRDRVLLWRGPVSDRLGYGAQKPAAARDFLREALDAALAGTPPPSDAPEAKGCAITWARPRERHIPDYARDVVPLLQRDCVACHRAGGIGPFAMSSYEKVRGWADMMRETVLTRRMSPWHADPDYGAFANDRGLGDEDRRTLIHWIDHGCPRGSGSDALAAKPAPASEWPLGKPDLVVELPAQEIPATGVLPYRTGSFAVNLPRDAWVRAVELRPGDARVLHHGFVFYDQLQADDLPPDIPPALRERLRNLDPATAKRLAEERKRKGGDEATGLTTFFASYVPGMEPRPFPKDTGKALKAGSTLRFQLHYTTVGEAVTDHPRLALYFAKAQPKHILRVTSAFDLRFVIPPGAADHQVDATRSFPSEAILYALAPHMHYRGSAMRFVAAYPDGKREILLSVPDYDMDWQATYHLAAPKRLPAGTEILVEGSFDNSARNPRNPDAARAVRFGEQTWDEMFIGYLVYSDP